MTIFNYVYLASLGISIFLMMGVGILCRLQLKKGRINERKLKESAAYVGRTIVPATLLGFGPAVTAGEQSPHVAVLMTTLTMLVLTIGAALIFYASAKEIRKRR